VTAFWKAAGARHRRQVAARPLQRTAAPSARGGIASQFHCAIAALRHRCIASAGVARPSSHVVPMGAGNAALQRAATGGAERSSTAGGFGVTIPARIRFAP
jgi:hypothetical protein